MFTEPLIGELAYVEQMVHRINNMRSKMNLKRLSIGMCILNAMIEYEDTTKGVLENITGSTDTD